MQITLPAEFATLVHEEVDSGAYPTADDVVLAAFAALEQNESFGDFVPRELDELLAEGEASIAAEQTLDGDAAFAARRARRSSAAS